MQQSGKLAARQFRLKQPGITEMDRLQQLVETLRVLARTNEPNRVVLIQKAINEYLNDKAGIVRLSLERLCNDIDREEAEKRRSEDWSIAKDYVRSRLRRLA
jgi:DNA integrity scanning protein DisA with diadenylate cyclase activity